MNLFERVVEKIDGRVCGMVLLERERERERERVRDRETERQRDRDFSGLKDMFEVFHQFVVLSRPEEKDEVAACQSEG